MNAEVKVAPTKRNIIKLQFPFRVQQVGENEVEITMGDHGMVFISPDVIKRNYPWLNDAMVDELVEALYKLAQTTAIIKSIVVK